MCPIRLNFYLYSRVKRYLPILKMAEELIGNLGYGAPVGPWALWAHDTQSDTKHRKLL